MQEQPTTGPAVLTLEQVILDIVASSAPKPTLVQIGVQSVRDEHGTYEEPACGEVA